ncbi:MAG: transcriptional regulator [Bacteroidota bacterium]|nr:transcriptional regulator [Bacteroidota bacterium]
MNYIKLLAAFFDKVAADDRLNPTHISMYVSLFQFWNASRFQNPISISRGELMRVSKISAKATYHKCMRELHEFGYVRYQPSYNPFKGSLVYLFSLQSGDEQVLESSQTTADTGTEPLGLDHTNNWTGTEQAQDRSYTKKQSGTEQALVAHRTKIETGSEQAQEPYINSINSINKTYSVCEHTHEHNNDFLQKNFKSDLPSPCGEGKGGAVETRKEKSCAKKEKKAERNFMAPGLQEVVDYFLLKEYSSLEAEKFFNYFQSNGWLVGGKTKMINWQAAARNWILNIPKFSATIPKSSTPVPKGDRVLNAKQLHASTEKEYNEPL